jgi:hypothetical protein
MRTALIPNQGLFMFLITAQPPGQHPGRESLSSSLLLQLLFCCPQNSWNLALPPSFLPCLPATNYGQPWKKEGGSLWACSCSLLGAAILPCNKSGQTSLLQWWWWFESFLLHFRSGTGYLVPTLLMSLIWGPFFVKVALDILGTP